MVAFMILCKMPPPKNKANRAGDDLVSPFSLFLSEIAVFRKYCLPFTDLKIVINSNKRGRKIPVSVSKWFLLSFM